MGRVGLDFSTQREEHVRLGVEWEEARLAGTDRAQLLERLRLLREVEGSRMGRSFGLREMARSTKRRLISLAQSPRDLVFISLLAKEVVLV